MNKIFYEYLTNKIGIIPCVDPKIILFSNNKTLKGSNIFYFRKYIDEFKNKYVATSLNDAIKNNVNKYIEPRGCRHGHVPIYDLNEQCVECTQHIPPALDGRASPMSIMMRHAPDMVISRKDAVTAGFTVYRDGLECHKGHKKYRYIRNDTCVECQKEYRYKARR